MMAASVPDPTAAFETWLLRRLSQAVEAGDVPADLVSELQVEFEVSRGRRSDQCHADAVRDIAVNLQMPLEKVEAGLAALEAQPRAIRELLMRQIQIAEAWLEGQRRAYRRRGD